YPRLSECRHRRAAFFGRHNRISSTMKRVNIGVFYAGELFCRYKTGRKPTSNWKHSLELRGISGRERKAQNSPLRKASNNRPTQSGAELGVGLNGWHQLIDSTR